MMDLNHIASTVGGFIGNVVVYSFDLALDFLEFVARAVPMVISFFI
jgi:hypothetical protein